jgi:hypothetical protein
MRRLDNEGMLLAIYCSASFLCRALCSFLTSPRQFARLLLPQLKSHHSLWVLSAFYS